MKVIAQRNWDYTAYDKNGKIYLEVLCGTSAMFNVTIELTNEQVEEMKKDTTSLEKISQKVRDDPDKYS
jgi:hypothetical protein